MNMELARHGRATGTALALTAIAISGCLSSQARSGYDELLRESAALDATPPQRTAPSAAARRSEAELAVETRLTTVLRVALSRNPELRQAGALARASAQRVKSSGRLPDLELEYEQLGVPLDRPYALDEAQMLTLGVSQRFPAPGSLSARSESALHEAKMSVQTQRARRQTLRARVQQAYFAYARAHAERAIGIEHVQTATRIVELARARYVSARGSQHDVLRAGLELSRLQNRLAVLEFELVAVRARLNTEMARAPDAALGPPALEPVRTAALDAAALERRLLVERPELASAERAVRRSHAALAASRSEASWPSVAVGADYWLMPRMENPHAYGAMVSINLPWLNPQHDEQVREAEHLLDADRRGLEAVRNQARYELREAVARHDTARVTFATIEGELLDQARQSYDAAVAAFAAGGEDALDVLDALRSLLEVRLEQARALEQLQSAAADVELAVGGELPAVRDDQGGAP
jgi:outer membrane protein TolC